ncbi:hypothetical protein F5878DRAFT_412103 [Lentinula raphanica]|uniref:Secreted protein n=1 Tax=Lentinula raphanica TaxID=153919 RepID=A0AA38PGP6_9AGAR|nr:hypothetical protein F5878DRAFT_412103 [Lentinula raphanica]
MQPNCRLSKLIVMLLLLVTILGVCSASPLPEKHRRQHRKKPTAPPRTIERFVGRPTAFERFASNARNLLFGVPKEPELDFLLGYAWMKRKRSTTRITPKEFLDGYPESSDAIASSPPSNHCGAGPSNDVAGMMADTSASTLTIDIQLDALERLEALSKILRDLAQAKQSESEAKSIEYRYYFPSSNYVDKCDPGGAKQAQAWINKKQADALNIVYIPFVKKATEKTIKHHFRNVKRGVDMSTVTVIAELGDGLYALLIPNPGPVKFRVGLDFENKDLRAAKWQNLKGVRAQQKKQLMPDQYY